MEDNKTIDKEKLEEINKINIHLGELVRMVGDLEVQKDKVISRYKSLNETLIFKVKDALVEAGIPENELSNYRIDAKDGSIMPNSEK